MFENHTQNAHKTRVLKHWILNSERFYYVKNMDLTECCIAHLFPKQDSQLDDMLLDAVGVGAGDN